MMGIRRADDRGVANFDWLLSKHSFSFGHYYDPRFMGFGPLRVINDDRVQPGKGFDTHGHQNMEIISYVLEGALAHKDSIGTGSVIRPGDVQRMSAGTGVRHSEFNDSKKDLVHFLQIWIMPEKDGLEPSYEQKAFAEGDKRGKLRLVGSRDGRDGSITIHQDVDLYAGLFDGGETASLKVRPGRAIWVQVARGTAKVNGEAVSEGDGVAMKDEPEVTITDGEDAEVLVFDMGVN